MAYCFKCGEQISEKERVCPVCGAEQYKSNTTPDEGGFLWGLLGFCIPLAGLILYLIWKDERPKTAKAAGVGALVSVGMSIVFYILYFIIVAIAVGAGY